MRRVLILSVVLVSGCHQAPPAADTSGPNVVKANKEMSDLLRKADAVSATSYASMVAAPEPAPPQPATSTNPPVAPADPVRPATPAKSRTDVMRDEAEAAFGPRLGSLRRTAEAARLKKDRNLQVCQGKVPTSECQLLTADIADATRTLEHELGDIEESARRARIDPGLMHDLIAKYGF
jgi:type IV secretory pathway VirB10-like protein